MANFEAKLDVRMTQADLAYLRQMTGGGKGKMSALVRGWIEEKIQKDRELCGYHNPFGIVAAAHRLSSLKKFRLNHSDSDHLN